MYHAVAIVSPAFNVMTAMNSAVAPVFMKRITSVIGTAIIGCYSRQDYSDYGY